MNTNLILYKIYNEAALYKKLSDSLDNNKGWEGDDDFLLLTTEERLSQLIDVFQQIDFDDGTMSNALGEQIDVLQSRKDRLDRRRQAIRTNLLNILSGAGINKVQSPTCTISINSGQYKLRVTDESLLNQYQVAQAPKLNRTALKRDLINGHDVEGAELYKEPCLVIRRK